MQTSLIGTVFANSALAGGKVFGASAVDYDNNLLYSVVTERFGETVYLATLNLATGNSTVCCFQDVLVASVEPQ